MELVSRGITAVFGNIVCSVGEGWQAGERGSPARAPPGVQCRSKKRPQ